jgi:hypothetical protein
LSKITIGAAAGFMLFALILSLPIVTGTRSVLQSGVPEQAPLPSPTPAAQSTPAPAAPAAVPTSTTLTPSPAPTKKK